MTNQNELLGSLYNFLPTEIAAYRNADGNVNLRIDISALISAICRKVEDLTDHYIYMPYIVVNNDEIIIATAVKWQDQSTAAE